MSFPLFLLHAFLSLLYSQGRFTKEFVAFVGRWEFLNAVFYTDSYFLINNDLMSLSFNVV